MARNGCFNVYAKDGYWAQDGWYETASGRPYQAKFVWVDNPMSRECRYDHRMTDPGCQGCEKQLAFLE